MAASNYNTRGPSSVFATVASLGSSVGPLDTVLPYTALRTAGGDQRAVGEGILLGQEIVRLISFGASSFTVARGCADTIPAAHPSGTLLWFYEEATGSDRNAFAASRTIGVKVRPQTVGGGPLAVENSPPNTLTFNFRFARPYPPGNVKVNGNAWFAQVTINETVPTLLLAWAHRDRVLQADQLIAHGEGNIGPEPGTTYKVQLRRSSNNALVKEYAGLNATSFDYPRATICTDAAVAAGVTVDLYLLLTSVREGLESMQPYRVNFKVKGV